MSTSKMIGRPEGWYDSPDDPNWRRWWNGDEWTDHAELNSSGSAQKAARSLSRRLEIDGRFKAEMIAGFLVPLLGLMFSIPEFVNRNHLRGVVLLACSMAGATVYSIIVALIAGGS